MQQRLPDVHVGRVGVDVGPGVVGVGHPQIVDQARAVVGGGVVLDDGGDDAVYLDCAREIAQSPDHVAAIQPARGDGGGSRDDRTNSAIVNVRDLRVHVPQTRRQGVGQGQALVEGVAIR